MLYISKLTTEANKDSWDTTQGMIITAESEEEAIELSGPKDDDIPENKIWNSWTERINITIECLGTANENQVKGIDLVDFKAG